MITGQLPGVVRVPTFQDHESAPVALARFVTRPWAVLGPDV
jgi:hypothetical protein